MKGLSAPVGSAICGSADFIKEARRNRKVVGGAMRQAGVIAAATIVALEQMIDRLAEDHQNARALAEGLAEIRGLAIDLRWVQTNIVIFDLSDPSIGADRVVRALAAEGVKLNAIDAARFRTVTHYGIGRRDIDLALAAARRVMEQLT